MDATIDSALSSASAPSGSDGGGASSAPSTPGGSPAPDSADAAGSAAQSSSSATPASATASPDDDETITDATTFTLEKHKRILENARRKEAARVEQAIRQQYGNVNPDEFNQYAPHFNYIKQHGLGAYYRALSREFAPQTAPETRPPQGPPPPDLVASDGTPAYSAPQLQQLLAYERAQLQEQWNQTLQPLQQTHATVQAREMWSNAVQSAQEQLAEAKQWEGWSDVKDKVAALMRQDGRFSLEGAYNRVFQTEYLPSLKAKTRQSVLDEIKHARDGNTAKPGASPRTAGSKGTPRSLDDQIDRALESALSQSR